jgi:glycosyltransferase involved in cell wall biosynthesis
LPYNWTPNTSLLRNAVMWNALDLSQADPPIDVVIGTKFPSYLVSHPVKVVWLFHQYRQAYDFHGSTYGPFKDDPEGAAIREAVRRMDATSLGTATSVLTISGNTAARLREFNGIEADVVFPPPQRTDLRCLGDDGYILSVGRLDELKRIHLLIDALAQVPEARAVVVGRGDQQDLLIKRARKRGVLDRVDFRGWAEDAELIDLYGRARAVYYAPHDEDFGMVTVEAHLAAKPVITTTDSGGPLEFVREGVGGLVVEPTALGIAGALKVLTKDADYAARLGEAARPVAASLTWDRVIERLLQDVPRSVSSA